MSDKMMMKGRAGGQQSRIAGLLFKQSCLGAVSKVVVAVAARLGGCWRCQMTSGSVIVVDVARSRARWRLQVSTDRASLGAGLGVVQLRASGEAQRSCCCIQKQTHQCSCSCWHSALMQRCCKCCLVEVSGLHGEVDCLRSPWLGDSTWSLWEGSTRWNHCLVHNMLALQWMIAHWQAIQLLSFGADAVVFVHADCWSCTPFALVTKWWWQSKWDLCLMPSWHSRSAVIVKEGQRRCLVIALERISSSRQRQMLRCWQWTH